MTGTKVFVSSPDDEFGTGYSNWSGLSDFKGATDYQDGMLNTNILSASGMANYPAATICADKVS